ncbi:hypothetical protein ACKI1K_43445 [Streptomyces scabiei]|uniref:hypothetical protein n=1 Tax=Streptomyces scabiei TaxID=1930 RepID=UPI0038F73A8D
MSIGDSFNNFVNGLSETNRQIIETMGYGGDSFGERILVTSEEGGFEYALISSLPAPDVSEIGRYQQAVRDYVVNAKGGDRDGRVPDGNDAYYRIQQYQGYPISGDAFKTNKNVTRHLQTDVNELLRLHYGRTDLEFYVTN